jgi:tetratricopeptide (TPR) repeat protein
MLKVNIILTIISLCTFTQNGFTQLPTSSQMLYHQAIEHIDNERYAEAITLLNECIRLKPRHANAYAARAEVRERLKDIDGAMIDYAICVELLPDQFEPLFSLAIIRYELKLYDLAKQDFLKLQHLSAGETNRIYYRQVARSTGTDKIMTAQSGSIKMELYNYLGLIEMQLDNCSRAILYMDSAIQLNNTEADYFVNRALAKNDCGDKTAQDDFKKALAINPDHSLTLHNIAVKKIDSTEDTEAQLTAIIDADATLQYPFIARAYYRLISGNYKGADQDYTFALALDDRDPHLWQNRGLAREKLNDLTGAFNDYSHAIELKENFVYAWLNRGNVLTKQERFQDAVEDYSIAILHQPDYGLAYLNRALAKLYGELEGACEDLKQAEALGIKVDKAIKDKICSSK